LICLFIASPVSLPLPKESPQLLKSLKAFNLLYEIAGPHERYVGLGVEIQYTRRHYRELKDAPPLSDCDRFPSHAVAYHCSRANYCYRQQLEARLAFDLWRNEDGRRELRAWWDAGSAWDELATARNEGQTWVMRRRALARLKWWLGDEDFYAGTMPAALPVPR
jgi:hypothetical protein